ncbi:PadR family transcriptional regulator [Mammaliicoccus sciuri]|uniref:PadR family transcriptional regulator n=1 Tax=Mammaliicoccus sciuri TaxID=1296 RepID=UPI0037A89FD0
MNPQFKKGVLELIVLSIIVKQDQYGYTIIKIILEYISISEGSVYPILRRLVKNQYLDTYYEPSKEGPPRRYYSITEEGKKRLKLLTAEWKSLQEGVDTLLKGSEVK